MNLTINLDLDNENFKIDSIKFQKMLLLYNALEEGWSIKKSNESYIFKKNHEGKKEIYDEETDEELEPTIKESFASYFVKVGDLNLHIGYDHRGTTIEAEVGDLDSEKILKTLKFLVDIYQENLK